MTILRILLGSFALLVSGLPAGEALGEPPAEVVIHGRAEIQSAVISFHCLTDSSPAIESTSGNVGAFFDFNDDGDIDDAELLSSPNDSSRIFRWLVRTGSGRAIEVSLESSTMQNLNLFFLGDFNRDGAGDILVRRTASTRAESRGWTLLASAVDHAVPLPADDLPREPLPGERWTQETGADGRVILRRFAPGVSELRCSPIEGDPIPDVEIVLIPGEESVHTGNDGRFELKVSSLPGSLLVATRSGYRFARPSRTLRSTNLPHIIFQGSTRIGSPLPLGRDEGPYICPQFNSAGVSMTSTEEWGRSKRCPAGSAFLATDYRKLVSLKAPLADFTGDCCRLPAGDILTSDSTLNEIECPDDALVTAVGEQGEGMLRCTKINTERYRFGPRLPGALWGFNHSYLNESSKIDLEEIPLALRAGLGRKGFMFWGRSGCVARLPGAVLTGRGAGDCSALSFRQLTYRGRLGDPPDGTPVKIFPDCHTLENVYLPNAGCFPTE